MYYKHILFIFYLSMMGVKSTKQMELPVILVHGGAGDISDSGVPAKIQGVEAAVVAGYNKLLETGNAVDAAQAAVESMENDIAFNCGNGSVLNLDGEIEMDSIIMNGTDLKIGSVGALRNILHPISVARLVMEKSPHVFLSGQGANNFAASHGVDTVPAYRLVSENAKTALDNFISGNGKATSEPGYGTVGAVVVDINGHVAMATSTGGITGKLPGRIGDTPLPGSGGYADDSVGGVSATGVGESIMRVCLSHRILSSMKQGLDPTPATKEALEYMTQTVGGTAGAITVSNLGEIGIYFNSKRMAWAYKKGNGDIISGINNSPEKT